MRRLIAAAVGAAALAGAGSGGAADLVAVAPASVVTVEPTPLEWLRQVYPRIGRRTAVEVGGAVVPTIEWRRPVEVRVRTESGAPLSGPEQRAVRDLALVCDRGAPRAPRTVTEPNGTFVVAYDCVWLQGLEGR